MSTCCCVSPKCRSGRQAGTPGGIYLKTDSLLVQTKQLLRHFDLRARKRLGQHFLIDKEVLSLITASAEVTSSDVVLEVGPGLGVLTRELARQAGWVITIELDNNLAALLKQTLVPFNNITIINEDVLRIEPAELIQKLRFPPEVNNSFNYKLVANLPYYITSPVLRHFFEALLKPQIMVVMVQKEVAEAIVAEPGKMSVLSISVQYYGQPRIISYVPASCFYPAPEVDSAILHVTLYSKPVVDGADESGFFELVRAGFSAPRKQIVNSLAQGLKLSRDDALSLLEAADIIPQRRAETLTVDEWARMLKIFTQMRSKTL